MAHLANPEPNPEDLPVPPLNLPRYTKGFYALAIKTQYSGFVNDVLDMNPKRVFDRKDMEYYWVAAIRETQRGLNRVLKMRC